MTQSWMDTRTTSVGINERIKAHELLAEDQLVHLKSYRYQAVDKSYISRYILKHYWNFMVELLPRWLAPNAVTLIGFFCILINVGFLVIWMPDLVGPGPTWLYFSFAAGLWAYSTMDNIDGKQARRTGSSSPLGELFDHGIDSLNCTLASLCEAASLGLGSTPLGALTALIPCLPMFFSTWETYHTHVLYLGYFNGPTEGLIIGCLLMIFSGIYGPSIWSTPISSHIGLAHIFGPDTTFIDLWLPILIGSFTFIHLPFCIYNVFSGRRRQNLPILPIFLEMTPIVTFTVACCAWLGSPHSYILKENHLVLFCLIMSFVNGRMTTKIILAHLTKQDFPYWTVMLVPLVGGAVLANFPVLGLPAISHTIELAYLRCYLLFAFVVYARWATLVINAICGYLGISCLRIKKNAQQPLLNGAVKKL